MSIPPMRILLATLVFIFIGAAAHAQTENRPPTCDVPVIVTVRPPNHAMVPIMAGGAIDPDGDQVTYTVLSIFQDEPVSDGGRGDSAPDATLNPVQIRAERDSPGDGRAYYVSFIASDDEFSCTAVVVVCVPHDQGKTGGGCIAGGPLYNSTTP